MMQVGCRLMGSYFSMLCNINVVTLMSMLYIFLGEKDGCRAWSAINGLCVRH